LIRFVLTIGVFEEGFCCRWSDDTASLARWAVFSTFSRSSSDSGAEGWLFDTLRREPADLWLTLEKVVADDRITHVSQFGLAEDLLFDGGGGGGSIDWDKIFNSEYPFLELLDLLLGAPELLDMGDVG
jgi:hypothetical protein